MAGRPPKPTALKLLQGTARPDRMMPHEPVPEAVASSNPPEWMDATAKRHYRKLLRVLHWLTEADLDKLALYCQAYSRYRELTRLIGVLDFGSKEFEGWEPRDVAKVLSGLPRERKDAEMSMRALGSDLGMDPVSRTRINAKPPEKADSFDAWERGRASS